jgi:hypothetical protein
MMQLAPLIFANYLPGHFGLDNTTEDGEPSNVLEAGQFALSTTMESPVTGEPVLFGTHVDHYNDSRKGWNALVCLYFHFEYQGKFYRLALNGYSRKAVGHYYMYLRKDATNQLKINRFRMVGRVVSRQNDCHERPVAVACLKKSLLCLNFLRDMRRNST